MNINNYIQFIPKHLKVRGWWITILGVFQKLLDLVGIATLLPVIIVILDPSSIQDNSFIASVFNRFGFTSISNFGIVLGLVALLFIPLKSIFTVWFESVKNRYLLKIYKSLSEKMFDFFHEKGILFLRQQHSSQLAFHINGACYSYALNVVGTLMDILANSVIALGLTVLAFIVAPLASVLVFASMIPLFLIYYFYVREKIKYFGKKSYEARREQARIVQESIRGHISLIVNNSFDSVRDHFEKGLEQISDATVKTTVYQRIPSAISQICVAVALIILFLKGTAGGASTALFVVFGFAAIRLVPSVMSIVNGITILQNNDYVLEIISDLFTQSEKKDPETITKKQADFKFEHSIEINDIRFSFEERHPILSGFSLSVRKGETIGIRGITGGGKSTLFNILLGFYTPQSGNILIDGVPLSRNNITGWRSIIGYCEQDVYVANDTVAQNISMSKYDSVKEGLKNERILQLLESVGLGGWLSSLPQGLDTIIGESGSTMSGGQKQRIGIARALYKNPQVLLFDEATSSLDETTEKEIVELVNSIAEKTDLTIFIISHHRSALIHCDKIVEIS